MKCESKHIPFILVLLPEALSYYMKILQSIKDPIKSDLQEFERTFRQSMRSNIPLLDKITYYIVKRKGKQLRPIFVMLSAKICGEINPSSHIAASMIELLHTATLVHDDVVDDANMRRGFFSINALWKNKIAVLVGDYLLSRGLLMAVHNKEFRLLEILSEAVQAMSEGELMQMEKARRLDIDESVYFDIIEKKTASLIASSCAAGAFSTVKDEAIVDNMREFGRLVGIAFQIKDDLFDFGDDDIGKPRGIDIKEKKMTLPLIYALRSAEPKEKKHIMRLIRKHNEQKDKVREVISFVRKSGGIEYANDQMRQYTAKAYDLLNTFSDSPARQSMHDLVQYVIERKK
jgi:octaprenyl-diphosphate synthase